MQCESECDKTSGCDSTQLVQTSKNHIFAFPRQSRAVCLFVLRTIFELRRVFKYGPNTSKRAVLSIENNVIHVLEIPVNAFTCEIYLPGDAVRKAVPLDDSV